MKDIPNPSTSSLVWGHFDFNVTELGGTNKLKSYWKKCCSIIIFALNSVNLYER